jgi:PAS domain S-box-containing protein
MILGGEMADLRAAALFLDQYRRTIDAEVDRRLAREEPPPDVRLEIIRRFRSFCRLASIGISNARPSLDGLGGQNAFALERAVQTGVRVAIECGPPGAVVRALEDLSASFRAGIRRSFLPEESPKKRRSRKRFPNAGKRVRSAIDRIGDAYIALNLDTGQLFDVNPIAEHLLGTKAEHLLGRTFADLIAEVDRSEFTQLEARLDAGEDAGPTEIGITRTDGERVPIEVTVSSHTIGGKRLAIFIARERLYSTRKTTSDGSFVSSELSARAT